MLIFCYVNGFWVFNVFPFNSSFGDEKGSTEQIRDIKIVQMKTTRIYTIIGLEINEMKGSMISV